MNMIPTGRIHRARDNDFGKGAFEEDNPFDKPQTSMAGQLPHRGADPELQGLDTDFPEPGENPEHSGARADGEADAGGRTQDTDPGQQQKRNPGDQQEDPLAA